MNLVVLGRAGLALPVVVKALQACEANSNQANFALSVGLLPYLAFQAHFAISSHLLEQVHV